MLVDAYQELQKRIVKELRAGSDQHNIRASVVPFRSDYKTDSAICLTSVVFVPDDIAQDIHRTIVAPLKEIAPDHHYYSPDSMHITIKNIRTVHAPPLFTETDIEKVHYLFTALIPQHRSFFFSLEEVVAFTAGVSLIGYCDERLKDLVQALDAGLNEIGVPDNKQYVSDTVFFGNVTLCRYVRQPSRTFYEAVEHMAHVYKSALKVEEVHLITCNSVCAPESRNILYSYKLRDRLSKQFLKCSYEFGTPQALSSSASEARSQKSEVRSQKSEARSQKPEARSQKSGVRSQKPEGYSLTSDLWSLTSGRRGRFKGT